MVGVEFAPGQRAAVRRLALALFGAHETSWRSVGERVPAARRPAVIAPLLATEQ
jgi:hypothetical protein